MEVLAFIMGLLSAFFAELIPVSVMNAVYISDALDHLPVFSTITFILALASIITGIVAIVNKSKNVENKRVYKSFAIMAIIISIFSVGIVLIFRHVLVIQNNENSLDSQAIEEYFDEADDDFEDEFEEDELEEDEYENDEDVDYGADEVLEVEHENTQAQ